PLRLTQALYYSGASAGIGVAIAQEFAKQGCHLMLCGRDKTRLDQVVTQCQQTAPSDVKIYTTVGDVTSQPVQESIINNTVSQLGGIDVLVSSYFSFLTQSHLDRSAHPTQLQPKRREITPQEYPTLLVLKNCKK
ncbi:hypothetical protein EGW08_023786, partial [Elysia chlorotica]